MGYENIIGNIINIIFAIIGFTIIVVIGIRLFKSLILTEKSTDATVIDKQIYSQRVMSKLQAPYQRQKYVITFSCGNKKMPFEVSEFSYVNYQIKQKGILKYKGSRIINFS